MTEALWALLIVPAALSFGAQRRGTPIGTSSACRRPSRRSAASPRVSHAYQDAERNRSYRLRQAVGEPLMGLAPWSGVVFVGGFWLGIPPLLWLSPAYACGLLLFAIVTVPVEVGASCRAMTLLTGSGLADQRDADGIGRVLRASALTYIAGVAQPLGTFLALVLVAEAIRRVTG